MTQAPVVSVIVPTHNRRHLIWRAVSSVLAQTIADLECIIVDDASVDGTEDHVRSFEDTRVQYIRQPVNRGGSAARNAGIRAARGRYLAFLDDDDEWVADKLEKQLAVFQSPRLPDLAVVTTGLKVLNHDGEQSGSTSVLVPKERGYLFERILAYQAKTIHSTCAIVVDREVLVSEVLFDERLPAQQDRDFVLRVLGAGPKAMDYVSEPLTVVHLGHGPRVRNPKSLYAARQQMFVKYADQLKVRRQARGEHLLRMGMSAAGVGDYGHARAYLWSALRTNPVRPRFVFRAVTRLLQPRTLLKLAKAS